MPDRKRTKNASSSSAAASRARTSPIARVRASVNARALAEGRQPSSRAAARIRARVTDETPGRSLTANDTAAAETPARRATSAIVGRRRGVSGGGDDIRVSCPSGYPYELLRTLSGEISLQRGIRGGSMRGKQLVALGVALAFMPATAHAAEQVTVNKRLKDRREVAAGTRAYSVGFEDGRFYANGWH